MAELVLPYDDPVRRQTVREAGKILAREAFGFTPEFISDRTLDFLADTIGENRGQRELNDVLFDTLLNEKGISNINKMYTFCYEGLVAERESLKSTEADAAFRAEVLEWRPVPDTANYANDVAAELARKRALSYDTVARLAKAAAPFAAHRLRVGFLSDPDDSRTVQALVLAIADSAKQAVAIANGALKSQPSAAFAITLNSYLDSVDRVADALAIVTADLGPIDEFLPAPAFAANQIRSECHVSAMFGIVHSRVRAPRSKSPARGGKADADSDDDDDDDDKSRNQAAAAGNDDKSRNQAGGGDAVDKFRDYLNTKARSYGYEGWRAVAYDAIDWAVLGVQYALGWVTAYFSQAYEQYWLRKTTAERLADYEMLMRSARALSRNPSPPFPNREGGSFIERFLYGIFYYTTDSVSDIANFATETTYSAVNLAFSWLNWFSSEKDSTELVLVREKTSVAFRPPSILTMNEDAIKRVIDFAGQLFHGRDPLKEGSWYGDIFHLMLVFLLIAIYVETIYRPYVIKQKAKAKDPEKLYFFNRYTALDMAGFVAAKTLKIGLVDVPAYLVPKLVRLFIAAYNTATAAVANNRQAATDRSDRLAIKLPPSGVIEAPPPAFRVVDRAPPAPRAVDRTPPASRAVNREPTEEEEDQLRFVTRRNRMPGPLTPTERSILRKYYG